MKKLVLVLLVAMLSVPAFAAPVIKLAKGAGADLGKVLVYVDANSGSLASGIGLTVTATGGNITGVTGFKADGESISTSKGYGIYPGQITFDGGGVPTYNSPVASGIGTPVVKLEFGALYTRSVPANAPDPCSLLCKLTVATAVTKVEVAGDSVSCGTVAGGAAAGIIDEGLNAFAVNASLTLTAPECFPAGHPHYNTWVSVGKPNSWCVATQCKGNANGLSEPFGFGTVAVGNADLAILITNWKKNPTVDPGLGADFNHATEPFGFGTVRVGNADLAILITNWKKNPVADCLSF